MNRGLQAYQRGDFEQAAASWTEAANSYEAAGEPGPQSRALANIANAYMVVGRHKEALGTLAIALPLGRQSGDREQTASILGALGNAHIAIGPVDVALGYLTEGLRMARDSGNPGLSAEILNNLGNLLTAERRFAEAGAAYSESVSLATRANDHALAARALINAAMASMRTGAHAAARALLDDASILLRGLEPSHDKAHALINVGLAYHDLRTRLPESREALLLLGHRWLNDAAAVAESVGERRMESYAWGHLGRIYEEENRHHEALTLTRRAIVAAQQVSAPESLYRWQWQAGRLLRKSGAIDEAITSYRHAVRTFQPIRGELQASYGFTKTPIRESAGAMYFELVDLLLERAASLEDADRAGGFLIEARDAVELFKAAELRDYFRDDCVDATLAKIARLDVVAQSAVVVYPILLADRTELLVSLPQGLRRFPVAVGAETLTREVRQFRRLLEKRTTLEFLPHAQRLYDWLIRPIEAELAASGVDTLVFVPDGALRTIPMAALHDGKQYLISKYALATTPGLNLTDPRPLNRQNAKMLAIGVTQAVQGFSALPNVSSELRALRDLFGSSLLVDHEFVAPALEKKLKSERFAIVHVASHGQFENDSEQSYLLTFDEKLTMDRLDRMVGAFKFRDDPLELLTLSACDTAAGDDRAALGLAGIAIKAGARSALATLWSINDEASSELVVDFYSELSKPATSRAAALRRAQLQMLNGVRHEHPGFWSPFLMINNWL